MKRGKGGTVKEVHLTMFITPLILFNIWKQQNIKQKKSTVFLGNKIICDLYILFVCVHYLVLTVNYRFFN